MNVRNRYLYFNCINLERSYVRACCNKCGQGVVAETTPGEHVEEILQRIRAQFENHNCENQTRDLALAARTSEINRCHF